MTRKLQRLLKVFRLHPRLVSGVVLGLVLLGSLGGLSAWYFGPDSHLAAAEQALERRDYAEARRHLSQSLRWNPQNAQVHFLAARAARCAGDLDTAEEELRVCQRLRGPGDAISLERALIRAQRGDREIEDYLEHRVQQGDPGTLFILEVLTQLYLDTYQLFKARHCLDLYLERRPDDVKALLGRGFIWERLFSYADAVQDYRRAVAVDPHNHEARLRLAQTLLVTGPADEAAEQFVHKEQSKDLAVRLGLARARRQQGRIEEARQLLDALLSEHPRHPGILAELGHVALEQEDTQRAEGWLREAVTLSPADREVLYNLCQCLQERGRFEELHEMQTRLQRLDGDLKRLGELSKAVLKTPNDPALRYEMAQLFLRNGEEAEGLRWLKLTLREDPTYRPAQQAFAEYLQRKDGPEPAARHRQQADAPGAAPDSMGEERKRKR